MVDASSQVCDARIPAYVADTGHNDCTELYYLQVCCRQSYNVTRRDVQKLRFKGSFDLGSEQARFSVPTHRQTFGEGACRKVQKRGRMFRHP
jgi:hypothetical protein